MKHIYSSKITHIKLRIEDLQDVEHVMNIVFEWVSDTVKHVSLKTKPQILVDYRSIIKLVNGKCGRFCSAAVIRGVIAGDASHTSEKYLLLEVETES